jgi:SAM-dependent methyltransferase
MATDDTPGTGCTVAAEPGSVLEGWMPAPAPASNSVTFDPAVAHPARIYNYWLGGKDHFLADRKAAEELMRLHPQVVASAQANRAYLARVVRYLAGECGVRQFIDLGTGLPCPDNTHEIAQQVAADCRVVYVDNDPVVLTHARALLTCMPPGSCDYVEADVRDTGAIVAEAGRTLDLGQPVAVLALAVLHFLPDGDDPAAIVARLADALAPGSFITLSHLTADFAPEQVAAAVTAYNAQASVAVTPRTHAQVSGLFGGLPLVAPGVVPVTRWRPAAVGLPHRMTADVYAGAARIGRGRR